MKIIKQELQFEKCLKQRIEFICEFSKVTPTFINGSIRKLEKTNLTYIEPHRVIIKNITFLVFNYSNDVYISNLTKKIKLSELEEYFHTLFLLKNITNKYVIVFNMRLLTCHLSITIENIAPDFTIFMVHLKKIWFSKFRTSIC